MIFNSEKNWKQFLSSSDEERMNELIMRTRKHRTAYLNAQELKIAQLWCALLEVSNEKRELEERLAKLEYLLGGIADRAVKLDKSCNAANKLEKF